LVKPRPLGGNPAPDREAAPPVGLRAVSPDEFAHTLAAHRLYLETNRKQGMRGDLSATNLTGHNFSNAVLRRIKLDHALLRNVDFTRANLERANLIV
jgi:hypothetical protein